MTCRRAPALLLSVLLSALPGCGSDSAVKDARPAPDTTIGNTQLVGDWFRCDDDAAGCPALAADGFRLGRNGLWVALKSAGGGKLGTSEPYGCDATSHGGYSWDGKVLSQTDEGRGGLTNTYSVTLTGEVGSLGAGAAIRRISPSRLSGCSLDIPL